VAGIEMEPLRGPNLLSAVAAEEEHPIPHIHQEVHHSQAPHVRVTDLPAVVVPLVQVAETEKHLHPMPSPPAPVVAPASPPLSLQLLVNTANHRIATGLECAFLLLLLLMVLALLLPAFLQPAR